METPTASQLLLFGGVDVTVWHAPDRVVRGEILDRDMRRGTYLSDALVLGYRHYEAIPDMSEGFRQRLSLARARIDEVSFTARKVLTTRGILGVEGRGGAGWDSARDAFMWRAGAGLELAATQSSRLSLSYDFANESVVVWYALHIHHLPRTEDWPGMPVEWAGFTLRPRDFLDASPVRPKK